MMRAGKYYRIKQYYPYFYQPLCNNKNKKHSLSADNKKKKPQKIAPFRKLGKFRLERFNLSGFYYLSRQFSQNFLWTRSRIWSDHLTFDAIHHDERAEIGTHRKIAP